MPSGLAAKKLGMSPRTLGKITGNLYVLLADGTKEDIGLFVKHGSKGLCVPDYVRAQPEERGWAYSNALVSVLEQYKVHLISSPEYIVAWCQHDPCEGPSMFSLAPYHPMPSVTCLRSLSSICFMPIKQNRSAHVTIQISKLALGCKTQD